MAHHKRLSMSRLVGVLAASCVAIASLGGASASADDGSAAVSNQMPLDMCYTELPGDSYRVDLSTVNNSSNDARFTVDEILLGSPDKLHDEILKPERRGFFSHDVPASVFRDFLYRGEVLGGPGGFDRVISTYDVPHLVEKCFS